MMLKLLGNTSNMNETNESSETLQIICKLRGCDCQNIKYLQHNRRAGELTSAHQDQWR